MRYFVRFDTICIIAIHGEVLLLEKWQASASVLLIKSNTPPWMFFMFFKLYK